MMFHMTNDVAKGLTREELLDLALGVGDEAEPVTTESALVDIYVTVRDALRALAIIEGRPARLPEENVRIIKLSVGGVVSTLLDPQTASKERKAWAITSNIRMMLSKLADAHCVNHAAGVVPTWSVRTDDPYSHYSRDELVVVAEWSVQRHGVNIPVTAPEPHDEGTDVTTTATAKASETRLSRTDAVLEILDDLYREGYGPVYPRVIGEELLKRYPDHAEGLTQAKLSSTLFHLLDGRRQRDGIYAREETPEEYDARQSLNPNRHGNSARVASVFARIKGQLSLPAHPLDTHLAYPDWSYEHLKKQSGRGQDEALEQTKVSRLFVTIEDALAELSSLISVDGDSSAQRIKELEEENAELRSKFDQARHLLGL